VYVCGVCVCVCVCGVCVCVVCVCGVCVYVVCVCVCVCVVRNIQEPEVGIKLKIIPTCFGVLIPSSGRLQVLYCGTLSIQQFITLASPTVISLKIVH